MEDVEKRIQVGGTNNLLLSELDNPSKQTNISDSMKQQNTEDQFGNIWFIRNFLQSLYLTGETVENAGIISKYNNFGTAFSKHAIGKVDFFQSTLYQNIKNANGRVFWQSTHEDTFSSAGKVITAGALYKNPASSDEMGICVLNIKPDFFRNILRKVSINTSERSSLFIVTSDGTVVADVRGTDFEGIQYKDPQLLNELNIKNQRNASSTNYLNYMSTLVFYDPISITGWKVVAVIPDQIIKGPASKIGLQVVWVALISILFTFLCAIIMSSNITVPIRNMVSVMKQAESGDFSVRCTVFGKDEIAFLGNRLNTMMTEIKKSQDKLENLNKTLEMRIEERTYQLREANDEMYLLNAQLNEFSFKQSTQNSALTETLETLQKTQSQLVQSEKMAALGSLVAGMAHEINTPIGVSVTAVTFIEQQTQELQHLFNHNLIKKSTLENFLKLVTESSAIAYTNLYKASELIKNFKRVSVDMSTEEKCSFKLYEYVQSIIIALSPEFKEKAYHINVTCDPNLKITSYPGIISQILSNLIINSIIHGFEKGPNGNISITIDMKDGSLLMNYSDDGKGIPESLLDKVFDPFFTTKRAQGGTGLGLNIVYNLVTQNLGGMIKIESPNQKGVIFTITIPVELGETHDPIPQKIPVYS